MLGGEILSCALLLILLLCLCLPWQLAHAFEFSAAEKTLIQSLSGSQIKATPDPGNRVSHQPLAVSMGKRLFFDKRLSPDGKVACASCHQPDKGWADGNTHSDLRGIPLKRHTPGLWNVSQNRWHFWDGRADSLWSQAISSLEAHAEMNSNRVYLARLIQSDTELKAAYQQLFGPIPSCVSIESSPENLPMSGRPNGPDETMIKHWETLSACQQQGVNQLLTGLSKMIAAFETTLISNNARFDQFAHEINVQGKSSHLNKEEQTGLRLFLGKGKCITCHSGPNFSDSEFHSVFFNEKLEPGRYAAIPLLQKGEFNLNSPHADAASDSSGPTALNSTNKLDYLYRSIDLRHKFKTPTLRNLGSGAPYMHDGSMQTLEEVLEYYATIASHVPKTQHEETVLNNLSLSQSEISALAAFLHTLTEETLLGHL